MNKNCTNDVCEDRKGLQTLEAGDYFQLPASPDTLCMRTIAGYAKLQRDTADSRITWLERWQLIEQIIEKADILVKPRNYVFSGYQGGAHLLFSLPTNQLSHV